MEDTWEPIINQAEDNPALLQQYLQKISAEEAALVKSVLKDLATILPRASVEMIVDN